MRRILWGFLRFWRLMPVYWSVTGKCYRCGCGPYWMFREHNVCAGCLQAYEIGIGASFDRFSKYPHIPCYDPSDFRHQIRCGQNHWPESPVLRGKR